MGELAVLAEPSILSLENNKEEENVFSNRYFRMNILIKNLILSLQLILSHEIRFILFHQIKTFIKVRVVFGFLDSDPLIDTIF